MLIGTKYQQIGIPSQDKLMGHDRHWYFSVKIRWDYKTATLNLKWSMFKEMGMVSTTALQVMFRKFYILLIWFRFYYNVSYSFTKQIFTRWKNIID